jgi:hypothetical protein
MELCWKHSIWVITIFLGERVCYWVSCFIHLPMFCVTKPLSLSTWVSPAPLDTWVVAATPARVDLSGGWSNMPPICVEYGGAICGISVTMDGQKPLSCWCWLISGGSGIVLKTEGRDKENKTYELTHLTKASDSICTRILPYVGGCAYDWKWEEVILVADGK